MKKQKFQSPTESTQLIESHLAICQTCQRPLSDPAEEAERRGRRLVFPSPMQVPDAMPVTFRTKAEVVELYNQHRQAPERPAASLSSKVQSWCRNLALEMGWGEVYFPTEFPNKTLYAGAVFLKATQ